MAQFDEEDLRSLPQKDVSRIVAAVEKLSAEPLPHGSQKLAGAEFTYRIRVGDYRVIYNLFRESGIAEIQRVRHRREAYR